MGFLDHLILRHLNLYIQYAWVDSLGEIITFPLYDMEGALTGYQRYDWKETKKKKYFSHITKGKLGVFGLDCLYQDNGLIFITEGIWDAIAIQSLGYSAIAVLANDPKHLVGLLKELKGKYSTELVAVCDGDSAGKKLAKYGDYSIILPEGEDPSSMTQYNLAEILSEELDNV